MKLGIFDSGIGGEAVAQSLHESFLAAEIISVNDKAHLPYGNRTAEDIIKLTDTAIQPLLRAKCDSIVIACNSATAAAIETLRERYTEQTFIGLEPMVKPAAAQSRTGIIAVFATPATLKSSRYSHLKELYAKDIFVIEPDCTTWASMIEHDAIDELIIKNTVEDIVQQGADVIVLACTHYHWIREMIENTTNSRAVVLDPSEAISNRVSELLKTR